MVIVEIDFSNSLRIAYAKHLSKNARHNNLCIGERSLTLNFNLKYPHQVLIPNAVCNLQIR